MNLYKYRKLLALAAAGAVATVGIGAVMKAETPPNNEIIYTVEQGDTLWDIAKKYKDPEDDIRQVIYEIKADNPELKGYLQPGQQLKISIKKELADTAISANSLLKR